MPIEIVKQQRPGANDSIVLIGRKNDSFDVPWLNKQELEYLRKRIKDKEKLVIINQYLRFVFVQLVDTKKHGFMLMEELRKAGCHIRNMACSHKVAKITLVHFGDDATELMALAEGIALSDYQFLKYYSKAADKKSSLKEIAIVGKKVDAKDISELNTIVDAVYRTRDLVNEPYAQLSAVRLAKEFQAMAKEAGLHVDVLSKAKIESLKMGGLLAVNQGSAAPPTFTVLEWQPSKAVNVKPYVLVGKGVTYDTGGLSLKPTTDSMDYMKSDMSGAAAVAAVMYAIARQKLPVHVVALIPATDNWPGEKAVAPGDVITMYDKTTVEVLNTDAEGRLILGDALGYAKKYNPQLTITVATLTGAAARAIGKYGIAVMGNASRKVFSQLVTSGENVYERLAEFPFWEEYAELLKSDVADIKNVGGTDAGAITAGKFLEHFTDYPFIHLDIAGAAFLKSGDSYRGKGATGVGVRLLYDFIKSRC
jgi:leucyl aminopeptidase